MCLCVCVLGDGRERVGRCGLGAGVCGEQGGGEAKTDVRVKIGAFTNDKSYVPPPIDKV